jgi:hypothetical protein
MQGAAGRAGHGERRHARWKVEAASVYFDDDPQCLTNG